MSLYLNQHPFYICTVLLIFSIQLAPLVTHFCVTSILYCLGSNSYIMSTFVAKCLHSHIFTFIAQLYFIQDSHFEVPHTYQMSLKNVLVDVVLSIVVDSDSTSNYLCSIPLFL